MGKKASSKISLFINSKSFAGVLLVACVAGSLVIANSNFGDSFKDILSSELGYRSASIRLKFSLLNWINDGLMAVFFFLMGLEIKQELINGHLSSFKKASVPVLAAMGGAIVPAIIFISLNAGTSSSNGWGIPMATDIAFAIGVLSLLGKRVPAPVTIFLTTLAVVDDLLAILVIALFYTTEFHSLYLLSALGIFLFLLILNKMGVKHLAFFIIPGIAMWYCVHHSGIHATIAGVLLAATIPSKSIGNGSPIKTAINAISFPVAFIIMPLFAIANSNIRFEAGMMQNVFSLLGLGIILGLVVGKPIGVIVLSWLTVKLNIGSLPTGMENKHIAGIGLLAGIGFTMSIFISFLSFGDSSFDNYSKIAILIGSTLSGFIGLFYLKSILEPNALK